MPYIQITKRLQLDEAVLQLQEAISGVVSTRSDISGVLNYCITTLITRLGLDDRYDGFNTLVGVLECVKLEMYRRVVAPYEDQKCQENGDVFPTVNKINELERGGRSGWGW